MPDVRLTAQQLAQGVSQQAPHLRLPGQVESAENVVFDIALGATRRNGTQFLSIVSTPPAANTDVRLFPIDRGDGERYLLMLGDGILRIFNDDGTEVSGGSITISSEATAYIAAGSSSADKFRVITIGDTTIIANIEVATGVLPTATYVVQGSFSDYDEMVRFTPADGTYYRALADTADEVAGFYLYDVDGKAFPTVRFPEVSGATYADPTGDWDNASGERRGLRITFQRRTLSLSGVSVDAGGTVLTKVGGFSFIDEANQWIKITGGTGVTAGWYQILSHASNDTITLATSCAAGATSDLTTSAIGSRYDLGVPARARASMQEVAQDFEDELIEQGEADAHVAWITTGFQRGYFQITGPWRGSGATIDAVESPALGGVINTDLTNDATDPFYAAGATITAGSGTLASENERRLDTDDRWTQVSPSGAADGSLDPEKMPIALVRTAATPTFDVDVIDWDERDSGDNVTNPSPQPFRDGAVIRDIAFFEQRLCFAMGEYIVASQSGDLFNFYQDTVTEVVDSDPIVAPISGDQVTLIDYMVPVRRTLLLFTSAGRQYEMGADGFFGPNTITITASTSYRTASVRPEVMGSFVYFVTEPGGPATASGFSRVMEYQYDDVVVTNIATDVTRHVPRYVPSGLRRLASDAVTMTMLAIKKDDDMMWCYRTHFNGRERQQMAWSTFTFDPTYQIRDAVMMGGELYMLVDIGGEYVFEKMPMERPAAPTGYPYFPHLDRWQELTGSFSAGSTTFDVTMNSSGSTVNAFVQSDAFEFVGTLVVNPGGTDPEAWTYTAMTSNVVVPGEWDTGDVRMGRFFTAKVTPTRPYVAEDGRPVLDVRLICRSMEISLLDTAGITVVQDFEDGRADVSYRIDGDSVTESDKVVRAWATGDVERSTRTIQNGRATNMTIAGLQWSVDLAEGDRDGR